MFGYLSPQGSEALPSLALLRTTTKQQSPGKSHIVQAFSRLNSTSPDQLSGITEQRAKLKRILLYPWKPCYRCLACNPWLCLTFKVCISVLLLINECQMLHQINMNNDKNVNQKTEQRHKTIESSSLYIEKLPLYLIL